ncbi:hypothetical protein FV232_22695 [Methylobacterium sp. WL30]|uniref:hypothetical protein n=1 Tax=unclassified Methylobacterium TaxID=2615210 RepID=UPI0011C7C4D2|nr:MULTISPECIES: hypothetical protein [unclassified Methylobacterium]TXN39357.1 hypothetical protein FV225_10235 [Methylobacterium sp. WL93]TXN49841.1 hypothetical protein FV227_14750 [Methylobacterium sp. WL119]TXN63676.1 hypothetical protein FV232_22695 [Methylobacterium sp. WL30]
MRITQACDPRQDLIERAGVVERTGDDLEQQRGGLLVRRRIGSGSRARWMEGGQAAVGDVARRTGHCRLDIDDRIAVA